MKETTRFMMLLAWLSISAFTLTSCLNSDDDEDEIVPALMTEAEISNYLSTFSGFHMGNLKVFFQNEQGKQDSVTVSTPCTVSLDKKVTFSEFPVSILKNYIKGEGSQELREALEAKGPSKPWPEFWRAVACSRRYFRLTLLNLFMHSKALS